ncbi:MAG: YdcF family protein [Bacteroidia bacterium]|nr:YdcF family protein [Bacteroidia bacterium]
MFFILSKVLLFLFSPVVWVLILLIWALLTKRPKRRRNLILTSFFALFIFSNSFVLDEVMRVWEMPPSKIEKSGKVYDYAVVLGGIMSYYDVKNEQIGFNRSVDRLMQAVKLYRKGIVKKIVFTGGDASVLKDGGNEGDIILKFIKETNIVSEYDFIVENASRNTHENAESISKLFKNDSLKGNVVIITSAFHMKRSLGCFKKAGMNPDYYLADRFSGKRKYTLDHLIVPHTQSLDRWGMILHEIWGYYIYKIMGYL